MPSPLPRRRRAILRLTRALANPADFFSGARLEESPVADNVVVFKRTSPEEMQRPRGVTHNYHHRFVLVIPLAKAGRIQVDGRGYRLRPGQAALIFPHQFHHFLHMREEGMHWLFLTFECRHPAALAPLRDAPRVFGPAEDERLQALLRQHLALPPGPEHSLALVAALSALLLRLRRAPPADCRDGAPDRSVAARGTILREINAYVRSHLSRPIRIPELARHTGYSASYVRTVFRREFGVSLGSYVRDSRLSMAAAALSHSSPLSVSRIARNCGFRSIPVFSRAFKRATGLSPRAYRAFLAHGGGRG